MVKNLFDKKCALNQGEEKIYWTKKAPSLSRTKKSSQQDFSLIFLDGILCMLCSTATQTTFEIQQRFLVLKILEIASCGNLTRVIAVLTALS